MADFRDSTPFGLQSQVKKTRFANPAAPNGREPKIAPKWPDSREFMFLVEKKGFSRKAVENRDISENPRGFRLRHAESSKITKVAENGQF